MFGVPQMEHDTRYDYAAEWIEIANGERARIEWSG
jgi:hypothetical protein